MESEIYINILYYIFAITFVVGWVVHKTDFCTMGAVSDWVNMGSTSRLKSWFLAGFSALLFVTLLDALGFIDGTLTQSNETANPPYNTSTFAWLRYVLGGLIFGIGMTIGSGCGNKTLVRIGGGNLKSVVIFLMMAFGAYLMIFTNFGYDVFLSWTSNFDINLSSYEIPGQDLGSITSLILPIAPDILKTIIGIALSSIVIFYLFKDSTFRSDKRNILSGLVIGIAVTLVWLITAGMMGVSLLEEAEMMDARPYALGAQSLTFVAPSAHITQYILSDFDLAYITIPVIAGTGVLIGSFFYGIFNKAFHIEWFQSWQDFFNHLVSGFLMGVGGVLGMGCTIGQGVTGVSTLSTGSFITLFFIIYGSALTMKVRYYKLMYEEDATFIKALMASLADLKCIPNKWRMLERV